jgi:hypothetical protein
MTALRLVTPKRPQGLVQRGDPVPRRVSVFIGPDMPVCRVEVEVFDALIGRFDQLAANDNEPPNPDVCRGHDPPEHQ